MSDEKTTQFADAATLDGTELVGIVQSGANVQTTTYTVSNFVNTRTFVQMGKYANGGGESGVAIGYYAQAFGPNPIAIGNGAYSDASGGVAIGYHAEATNSGGVAIGTFATNHSNYGVTIGSHSLSNGNYAIAVGAYANAEGNCIAIGAYAKGYYTHSIAIGGSSHAYGQKAMALGYQAAAHEYAALAIGTQSYAVYKSVAVGYRARASNYSVAIGVWSECLVGYGIAIGPYSYTIGDKAVAVGSYSGTIGDRTVAIGAYSHARADNAVAIGAYSTAEGSNSFALGAFASSAQQYSMVIGSSSTDLVSGSLVVSGYPVEFALRPCDHYQKFVGQTIPAVSATAEWSGDGWTATISYPGSAGNGFYAETAVPDEDNVTLLLNLEGNTMLIILGTDGDGNPDASQNTLANIASLFPNNSFTFQFTGPSDSVVTDLGLTALSGGEDGTPSCILTSDGNTPTDVNTLAIWPSAIATLSGRVTGAGTAIFGDGDDAACFVLAPLLLYRDSESNYTFVGDNTLTLENSTGGGADWPVPTLTVDDDTGYLEITVVNTIETVNWMAHFKFETSQ